MKEKVLITVNNFGRIPPLYQDGPIVNPIWVGMNTAYQLVSNHYNVFEHDPNKPAKKIKSTVQNLEFDNFPPYIPEAIIEKREGGTPVTYTSAIELPEHDKQTTSSFISDQMNDENSEKNTQIEADASEKTKSIYDRAKEFGINPDGLSKNKLKALVREKEQEIK